MKEPKIHFRKTMHFDYFFDCCRHIPKIIPKFGMQNLSTVFPPSVTPISGNAADFPTSDAAASDAQTSRVASVAMEKLMILTVTQHFCRSVTEA